jgi:hypothetical protein
VQIGSLVEPIVVVHVGEVAALCTHARACVRSRVCVCVHERACVRACVRSRVCAVCVRARVRQTLPSRATEPAMPIASGTRISASESVSCRSHCE